MSSLNNNERDEFYYHEALDRCCMITEIFEEQLRQHACISSLENEHPVKKTAENISNLLGELYQKLGELAAENRD